MAEQPGVTTTMVRFGFPRATVAEYRHWVVLLRDRQATLGALVLACREPATAFSGVTEAGFEELARVIRDVETGLGRAFAYDKINYLMLMMVDPHVHFHAIPRYSGAREFAGLQFADPGWPHAPDLGHAHEIGERERAALLALLRERWPVAPSAAGPR